MIGKESRTTLKYRSHAALSVPLARSTPCQSSATVIAASSNRSCRSDASHVSRSNLPRSPRITTSASRSIAICCAALSASFARLAGRGSRPSLPFQTDAPSPMPPPNPSQGKSFRCRAPAAPWVRHFSAACFDSVRGSRNPQNCATLPSP